MGAGWGQPPPGSYRRPGGNHSAVSIVLFCESPQREHMFAPNETFTLDDETLLGLNEERPWVVLAACRDADPAVFFPGPDGDAAEALKYCSACLVRVHCLDYALEARERYGVWGGTTEKQRKRLMRRAG